MKKNAGIIFQGKSRKGTDFIIRYPKMSDLRELWIYINKLSKERTFVMYQGEKVSLCERKEWLEKSIERIKERKEIGLSAFVGKKVIGMSGVRMGNRVKKHVGNFGISIDKRYRGEGIGWSLMNTVIKEARKKLKGLKIVVLEVFSENKVGINLYRKMGFKKFSFLPNGLIYKGKYIADVGMYKKIK